MSLDARVARPASVPPVHDFHAHAVPAALLSRDAWSDPGIPTEVLHETDGVRLRIGDRVTPNVSRGLTDVGARLAAMDDGGVDVQVVSPWLELYPAGLAADVAEAHVRVVNDALSELVHEVPDRLAGMAMVPLADGARAAAELARAVDQLGMCGAILPTSVGPQELTDPGLEPLWAAAAVRHAILMLHPFAPLQPARLRAFGLGDALGTPLEGAVAVAALLRAGVLERHPELRLCVVHGGGPLPALAGRLDVLWSHAGPVAGRPPSQQLRDLYFDTLTHGGDALRWLWEFAGADRLLLGSDYPFPTGEADPVRRVRELGNVDGGGGAGGTDGAVRAAILGGNAARLLAEVRSSGGASEVRLESAGQAGTA